MVRITDQGRELIERMRGNIARDLANLMAQGDTPARTSKARTIIARHSGSKASLS